MQADMPHSKGTSKWHGLSGDSFLIGLIVASLLALGAATYAAQSPSSHARLPLFVPASQHQTANRTAMVQQTIHINLAQLQQLPPGTKVTMAKLPLFVDRHGAKVNPSRLSPMLASGVNGCYLNVVAVWDGGAYIDILGSLDGCMGTVNIGYQDLEAAYCYPVLWGCLWSSRYMGAGNTTYNLQPGQYYYVPRSGAWDWLPPNPPGTRCWPGSGYIYRGFNDGTLVTPSGNISGEVFYDGCYER